MSAFIVNLICNYCVLFPIHIGKGKLMRLGRKLLLQGKDSISLLAHSKHGIDMEITLPQDAGWDVLYFRETYETGTTNVFETLLRENDTVLDIGANMGWYTILSAKLCSKGVVHAFEPVPFIFNKLNKNCELNKVGDNIVFNNCALGDEKEGSITMYTFKGLYHGHSSMSTLNRNDFVSVQVPMTTLDNYIATQQISNIDFIKMDTEGAEMKVLDGAHELMSSENPPIWLIELNEETSAAFGYKPHELIDRLLAYHPYTLYAVKGAWGKAVPMKNSHDYTNGDNLLCIPMHRRNSIKKL